MAQVELTTPADLAGLLALLREQRVRSFRLGSLYVELQPDQKLAAEPAQSVSRETPPAVESLKDRAERLKREEEELLYASAGGR